MPQDYNPQEIELRKLVTDIRAGTFFQVVVHLGHYIYAMSRLRQVASTTGRPVTSLHIFYIESLYSMLANWFEIKGKRGSYILKHALATLGLDTELLSIDKILDSPVGNTTFRKMVKEFRNAQGTHQIFKGNIQLEIAEEHSMNPSVVSSSMQGFLDQMFEHIKRLQARVEAEFAAAEPELYEQVRSYFVTGKGLV